jgi:hypothetical protein
MSDLKSIYTALQKAAKKRTEAEGKSPFALEWIGSDASVIKVTMTQQVELPIFLSMTGDQLLAITYLFNEDEINPELKCQMHEAMLDLNVPMPLSSFAKTQNRYIVFGALSAQSKSDVIIQEMNALSDNSREALEAMAVYLR